MSARARISKCVGQSRIWRYWLIVACLAVFGAPLLAEEPKSNTPAKSTIEYRRIYVPAEKTDAWPRGGEKYIPVEARDFDAWIKSANAAAASPTKSVIIENAEYHARLENDGRLRGTGRWDIDLRGEAPAFLPLG